MKRTTPHMRGQVGVIMTLVLATLIGAVGLCADVGVLYFNWVQLQKAADSAALAGALHLTGIPATTDNSTVVATADHYAQLNGIKSAEIVSTTVAGDAKSVTIQLQRTVPYLFARVLGLTNGAVAARATAGINNASSYRGMLPIGLPCTKAQSASANCNGQYKQYSQGGGLYNLSTKFPLGATGSWGKLALGGTGISTFDNNHLRIQRPGAERRRSGFSRDR
jgi:Flp pilus assembly protein TadG